jgi:hypothetical protein
MVNVSDLRVLNTSGMKVSYSLHQAIWTRSWLSAPNALLAIKGFACFPTMGLPETSTLEGSFEPSPDPGYFSEVKVDPEAATVVWPNGVDLAPEVLYQEARKTP